MDESGIAIVRSRVPTVTYTLEATANNALLQAALTGSSTEDGFLLPLLHRATDVYGASLRSQSPELEAERTRMVIEAVVCVPLKYVKAKDEIASTSLTAKAQKDRYASAVWQVALRTLHEVFEADRAGKIHSIALTVAVDRVAPATGLPETIPFVIVAAEREAFSAFDLSGVVPEATLAHLGAAMSKSPYDYTPAAAGRGVRTKGPAVVARFNPPPKWPAPPPGWMPPAGWNPDPSWPAPPPG